jgi:antitoxin ParD1/3/4
MVNAVKTKAVAGEYATENEVIRNGLRALMMRDRSMQNRLHEQAGSGHDALKIDLTRTVPVGHIRASASPLYEKAQRNTIKKRPNYLLCSMPGDWRKRRVELAVFILVS